jgi:splicing factor 3B subunit 3
LLQSELGDLYKLIFSNTKDDVHNISLQYFDSIPLGVSICILRRGFLFVPCERGNHLLFSITNLGNDEENPAITDTTMSLEHTVYFLPRLYRNLELFQEMENLTCITDTKIEDLTGEGNPQIYTLCAAGTRSSLRILRHGLGVTEIASSPLPATPLGIWTISNSITDDSSKYIIISYANSTLVLGVGENVGEVTDSGMDLHR